jgi:hypothetical protein
MPRPRAYVLTTTTMQLTDQQLFERCQCGHIRARHCGGTGHDGICDRCFYPRFTLQSQAGIQAEAGLLNSTLKVAFDALAPFTRKAA